MTEKLLSDKEVKRLAGPGTKLMLYPQLRDYNNISEAFGKDKKIIILYVNEKSGDSIVGHWCALSRRGDIVEFDDSYGKEVDAHLDNFSKDMRIQTGQESNYLTRLLYDYVQGGGRVEYGEKQLQNKSMSIATCGRWCGIRLRFHDIPIDEYQAIWKGVKDKGFNLDEVVTKLTDKLLSK